MSDNRISKRDKYRSECNKMYISQYDALCEELPEYWQPYCVHRTPEVQEHLLKNKLSKAQAWDSAHQYGCGSDWTVWEGAHPEWPEFSDPIWQEYIRACEKVGLECLDFERPHNQVRLSIRWARIGDIYRMSGEEAAIKAIRKQKRS